MPLFKSLEISLLASEKTFLQSMGVCFCFFKMAVFPLEMHLMCLASFLPTDLVSEPESQAEAFLQRKPSSVGADGCGRHRD